MRLCKTCLRLRAISHLRLEQPLGTHKTTVELIFAHASIASTVLFILSSTVFLGLGQRCVARFLHTLFLTSPLVASQDFLYPLTHSYWPLLKDDDDDRAVACFCSNASVVLFTSFLRPRRSASPFDLVNALLSKLFIKSKLLHFTTSIRSLPLPNV